MGRRIYHKDQEMVQWRLGKFIGLNFLQLSWEGRMLWSQIQMGIPLRKENFRRLTISSMWFNQKLMAQLSIALNNLIVVNRIERGWAMIQERICCKASYLKFRVFPKAWLIDVTEFTKGVDRSAMELETPPSDICKWSVIKCKTTQDGVLSSVNWLLSSLDGFVPSSGRGHCQYTAVKIEPTMHTWQLLIYFLWLGTWRQLLHRYGLRQPQLFVA